MADPLHELLQPHLSSTPSPTASTSSGISKYLSRLVSLRLGDLTTTEPQSLAQSAQSNLVSIQALSSRSHRTTTAASDHLSTLRTSIPRILQSVDSVKQVIPSLDSDAVNFASSYGRSRDDATQQSRGSTLLAARRNAALLGRQADKAQDILELPSVLRASIAAANTATATSSTSASGANYSQALDLFAHIKRLHILYPDSQIVKSVLAEAEVAMKDMTTNLIANLRGQNLRLAAAIRMIGWLRRVMPELSTCTTASPDPSTTSASRFSQMPASSSTPDEGHFGAIFLVARLCTFLTVTEALAPLRELADQETQARKEHTQDGIIPAQTVRPPPSRKASGTYNAHLAGQQTERYLKRYIEIFREQSFATISMYRNVFPADEQPSAETTSSFDLSLMLPSVLQTFPLYLVELFMETLKMYLPNVADAAARESLLMQVLYAANSLGRLGADFSLMIAELYEDEDESEAVSKNIEEGTVEKEAALTDDASGVSEAGVDTIKSPEVIAHHQEPEWITVIKKHRIQAARLEALAAGPESAVQNQGSIDIPVR